MKSLISKTLALLAVCTTLFSFTSRFGGEGFEIYLNNRVLLQQYGNEMNAVKNLQVTQTAPEDKLVIKYHHCGQVGKDRVITLRDGQDKLLKEFRYKDATTPVSAMEIKLKEITNLGKKTNLKLYYRSSELPKGRMLASLNASSSQLTKL
jgi:hypothetical protein